MSPMGLFSLPLELRQIVYIDYFASTTLTYPDPATPPLLLCCHQLRDEALIHVVPNARHEFSRMQDLVAFLTSMRHGDRRKLRYITMKGHGVELLSEEPLVYKRSWLRPYDLRALTAALDSFPALQLDTLTFENRYWHNGNPSPQVEGIAYQMVMYLIRAKKFPQLRYRIETKFRTKRVTPTTVIARQSGPPFTTEKELCALLPFWDNLFNERHGVDAGAGVELLGRFSDGDE
ncbi:MAG: hypothetical protein LQ349_007793, partial [Xanthoria aureola]